MAAVRLARHGQTLNLMLIVLLSGLGLAFLGLLPAPLGSALYMTVCFGATGMATLTLIGLMLEQTNPVRVFSVGLSLFLAGVLSGHWAYLMLNDLRSTLSLSGFVGLNLTLVWLMFTDPSARIPTSNPADSKPEPAAEPDPRPDSVTANAQHADEPEIPSPIELPEALSSRLSAQEREILIRIHQGLTYRLIAERLSISESSVKTYVQRIFRKLGVQRRRQLIRLIECELEQSRQSGPHGGR